MISIITYHASTINLNATTHNKYWTDLSKKIKAILVPPASPFFKGNEVNKIQKKIPQKEKSSVPRDKNEHSTDWLSIHISSILISVWLLGLTAWARWVKTKLTGGSTIVLTGAISMTLKCWLHVSHVCIAMLRLHFLTKSRQRNKSF